MRVCMRSAGVLCKAEELGEQVPPLHSQHRTLQGFQLCQVEEQLLWQYTSMKTP